MAKSKSKRKGKGGGKPRGATYADVLAQKRAIQKGLEEYGANQAMQIEADIQTQRAMWLMVCSIADAFGVGQERMKRDFFPALQANSDELEKMRKDHGDDYAYEKLKHRAEQVTGIGIEYMYAHELHEAGLKLAEDGGYEPLTRLDRIKEKVQWLDYDGMAALIEKYDAGAYFDYCKRLPECYDAIGTELRESKCRACLVAWLKEPAEIEKKE